MVIGIETGSGDMNTSDAGVFRGGPLRASAVGNCAECG